MILKTVTRMVCLWLLMPAGFAFAQTAVPGEYLVKIRDSAVSQVQGKLQGKAFLKAAFASPGMFHVAAKAEVADQLKNDPDVEWIEPNFILQSIAPEINEQNVTAQAAAKAYDQTGSPVKATDAWAISAAYSDDNRPIVAIVDTGMDKTHYVFRNTNALWVNRGEIAGNNIDDDFNGYVDDVNGWNFINNTADFSDDEDHGTHVSGIVLGATQDILATSLEPAKIRLMPLKFLDGSGSGTTAAAINAIYYAVNMGAKVINCSWGGSAYSHALHDAMTYAYDHGVMVVTAAGNYSSNNDATPLYPANYDVPSNISVAASTDADRLASFSNYGAKTVHVASPGLYVFSTVPNGYFSSMSGTSMAAPFVAGAAALTIREAPQLSGYQLRSLVVSTADVVSSLSGRVSSGGRINVLAMVHQAQNLISAQSFQPDYKPDYSADRSVASEGGSAAGGCGLVRALAEQGGSGPGSPGASGMLAVLLGLPVFVWFALRRQSPRELRRYERYVMQSKVVIRSGERELVGTMQTLSLGGVSFNVDEALERGGSVKMTITGPGGEGAVEVEGRIVWSEKNNAYGVQFGEVRDTVRSVLSSWTNGLVRQE